ncbi:MAG: sulfatase-like hydrolase/transferase [Candidatus Limnocylindrales bacterium]
MTRVRAAAALACALAVGLSTTLPAGALASAQVPPAPRQPVGEPPPVPRPDIIVVYIDDVPPLDGRLWTAERTPDVRRWIMDRGLTFTNAIGESPLCCPARASLLTGLHTHNHGVTRNEAALFDPRVSVASELRDVGYRTAWIGKYLNRYMSMRGAARLAHEAPWDTFQPMSGGGHGYYLWPKGEPRYQRPATHSMRLLQDLAVAELRAAPPTQPLFAVLSTYAGHLPNDPLPEWRGSARCAGVGRWKPPNHGAAANAGKPDWMRRWAEHQRPRVSPRGMPLARVCEDLLGVDQLVGMVVQEQSARGRLDDTLLVLTSDNGLLLGEYGLLGKHVPWSMSVPLAMAWPRAMGTTARTTEVPTSSIDLAPTFCAIAGCRMGPFPSGHATADGISLVPVMLGGAAPPRTALLSAMLEGNPVTGMPPWTAVTTYPGHPLGRWHYIRWATGRRELYDLAADPWEVHDVSQDPAYVPVRRALERLRRGLRAEGTLRPTVTSDARSAERVR